MTAYNLKWIALITMLIDHIGATIQPINPQLSMIMRIIGRMSFPLFVFIMSESIFYTHDLKALIKRLFIFALISEIPYKLAFIYQYGVPLDSQLIYLMGLQNVMFTFFFAALACYFLDKTINDRKNYLVWFLVVLALGGLADVDYGLIGILFVISMYGAKKYYGDKLYIRQIIMFFFCYILYMNSYIYLSFACIPIILLFFYNGSKGKSMKYFFYWFYPIHITILAIIKFFI